MTVSLTEHRSAREQRLVETACRMFDAGWGARPAWQDVWRAHAAPDMIGYFNGQPDPNVGIDAFIAFQEELFEGFPDLTTDITDVLAEGDRVVVQSVLDGVQSGRFLGAPPSHARVVVPDVTIFRFAGEKIGEVRYFTDLLAVMTAIGAVRPAQ